MNTIEKTLAAMGTSVAALVGFGGKLYSDVELLKVQMSTQNQQIVELSKDIVANQKDLTTLMHQMDKRLVMLESTKKAR